MMFNIVKFYNFQLFGFLVSWYGWGNLSLAENEKEKIIYAIFQAFCLFV